jgi:parallel beta-helix repeat protein
MQNSLLRKGLVVGIILLFVVTIVVPGISGSPINNEANNESNSLSSEWRYPPDIIVPDDYHTIQQAVDNASQGFCIGVRNGTYNETILINKNDIILEGCLVEETIITGTQSNNTITIQAVNVTVADFSIVFNASAIEISGNYCKILNNNINGYGEHDRSRFAIKVVNSKLVDICENKIYGEKNCMDGIHLQDCYLTTISDNRIYSCSIGINLVSSLYSNIFNNKITQNYIGIYLLFHRGAYIRFNEISNNSYGIQSDLSLPSLIWMNNIFNNTWSLSFLMSVGIIIKNNIVNENADELVRMTLGIFGLAIRNYWGENSTILSPRYKCHPLFAPIMFFPWRLNPISIPQTWPD